MRQKTFDARPSVVVGFELRSSLTLSKFGLLSVFCVSKKGISLFRKRLRRMDYSSTVHDQIVAKGIEATIKPTMNPFR